MTRNVIPWLRASLVLMLTVAACGAGTVNKSITIGKKELQIQFDAGNGSLRGITDLRTRQVFIQDEHGHGFIWKLRLVNGSDTLLLDPDSAGRFRYGFKGKDGTTLSLRWTAFSPEGVRSMTVDVSIRLVDNQPMSDWKIFVENPGKYFPDRIWFPLIGPIVPLRNERLVVPQWMGTITDEPSRIFAQESGPKALRWSYPGDLSAECISIFTEKGPGLYLACNDTSGYRKSFFLLDAGGSRMSYEMENLPEKGAVHKETYKLPYAAIIGTFKGDWFTVARIYRKWARNQSWCRRSRLFKGEVPRWLLATDLWEWNRGRSDSVITPATLLQDKLRFPVSVFWHWWHGCPYDAGFPEYFPPREGSESFMSAISKAHADGLHAILYMNQRLWGMTTKSWTADTAARYAVKLSDGKIDSHVYNIFTGQPMASMCIATSFWRSTYARLASEGINRYGADGTYMDQACTSLICYDSTHGHPPGGGNYWIEGFDSLTAEIRSRNRSGREILLAGEGCGENWIPYLDLFLTLQVSRERYARPNDGWEVIPFFQAVYHPYAITYGNYSSLAYPPYDDLWPKKFKPPQTGTLLSPKFATQFYLEQARSFVWGMQPTIANFSADQLTARQQEIAYLFKIARIRRKALRFLLYGTMERPPVINEDSLAIPFSRVSIYAGQEGSTQSFDKKVPGVLVGAWRAKDGSVAFPVASITKTERDISLHLSAKEYDLPEAGNIYVVKDKSEKFLQSYKRGRISVRLQLLPLDVFVLEVRSKS